MSADATERFVIEIELADRYDAESTYDYIEGRMALLKVDGTLSMRTIRVLGDGDAALREKTAEIEHLRTERPA